MATEIYSAPNTRPLAEGKDTVPLDWIRPSALNPRKHFPEEALRELADSIARLGMLEPIVVRTIPQPQPIRTNADLTHAWVVQYEIIAGERRWRAAKLAGLASVPIRNLGDVADKDALEMALVENLQRQDLDPIEEAQGYAALNRVVGLKQAQIAAAVHRSQPVIANRMRLLELPEDVQERIRKGELSPSHGVALAKHRDFPKLASAIADYAAQRGMTSAEIEDKPAYGLMHFLQEKGAVESIPSYGIGFLDTCQHHCPFGAYRTGWAFSNACLKPEHYRELKAKEDAEHEAARHIAVAAVVDRATEAGQSLPKLSDLPYNSYKRLSAQAGDWPPGCTAECACRSAGLEYDGKAQPICTDLKRFSSLERKQTIADNRERRDRAKGLRAKLFTKIDALTELGPTEILILSSQAIADDVAGYQVSHGYREARKRRKLTEESHFGASVKALGDYLADKGALAVATLALESILGAELTAYADGSRGDAHLTEIFLGDGADAP